MYVGIHVRVYEYSGGMVRDPNNIYGSTKSN